MTNQVHRVSRYVSQQVWAIQESTLDVMVEILRMRAAGIKLSQDEVQARIGAGPSPSKSQRLGSVGVLPLYGVISPKLTQMTAISGGTSLDQWIPQFRDLRDDPDVSGIAIIGNTPGGSVAGLIEAADEIYKARAVKPVTLIVEYMVASAGLWIGSACSEIVCSPSGEIGSLGCYMVHEDWSKANEMMGVKPTYISYGKYKTEGHFDGPIEGEALEYTQAQVDKIGQRFEKTVAKYRGVTVAKVRADFGQGRMLDAETALAVGLVDRIGTREDTIARMIGRRRGASASITVAEVKALAEHGTTGAEGHADTGAAAAVAEMEPALKQQPDAKTKAVDPDEDGNCPEGYEKRDGMCHPIEQDEDDDAKARAAIEREHANIVAALSE